MLDGPRPPTGLVCVSDSMAVGVLRAVEDRGWVAGQDLAIVGFDDSPIASLLRPSLSSLRQPMVPVAGELVAALIAELSDINRRPSRILLAPRLVVRDSSGGRLTAPEFHRFEEVSASALSVPTRRSHFDKKSQQTPEKIREKGA